MVSAAHLHPAGVHSELSMEPGATFVPSDQWRRYGEARRKELISKDEADGGTSFHLHKKCRIQRYFQLAERVTQQFRSMYETWETNLDDTFLMGHRLVAFLEVALPQHPEYKGNDVSRLRVAARRELMWIKARMEELALRIDEEALNDFVSNDFVPEPDDESSVSSDDSGSLGGFDYSFGVFDPFDLSEDAPSDVAETDHSSSSAELDKANQTDPTTDATESSLSLSSEPEEQCSPELGFEEPKVYVEFHDDDGSEFEEECLGVQFTMDESCNGSSFLRQIADEAVRYETDSEAMDSWAQDGESVTLSAISSDLAPTFDPARIALREIMMNKLPKKGAPPPPPPPPAPVGSPTRAKRPSWASFDFATVRQAQ